MNDFNYYAPTKVVFGKGAEQKVGNLIKEQNCKKVLIHYGSGSARRSGLLDRIEAIFDKEGITYVELGGVVPNPRLSLVYEGIALCKKENVDFILAVGGGSVIDSAKAIGYGVANEGDVWDFFDFKRKPTACLPIGVVLTIAAAGSEMSGSCVITKEDGGMKRGCTTDYSRLKFAVLDPELTMTLPPYQTACGCTDILMHTMERYFNHGENMELTDGISEALMRTVIRNAKILVKEPENYDARAEVMWAGSLSHNGLTGCGTDGGDWATHKLEHELGGMFDVAHGAGLAAIWGSWARYVCGERIEGNFLLNGVADVVVSDGFSGNIALKTLEGAAKNLLSLLKGKEKQPIFKSLAKFILRFFFKDAYHRLKRINPDEYNGASLLGLTAVVVKSHGSANVDAFARAIADAALQARLQIPQKILAGLQRY